MARLNRKNTEPSTQTHDGGKASSHLTAIQTLRRSVMSCLLWEDTFYEDGQSIADRIKAAARSVTPKQLADTAIEARKVMNLRHVPLLLAAILCETGKGSSIVSDTISRVINRADELAEFVAIYAEVNGVKPSAVKKKLSAQAKKGLAMAFTKFDAYQLGKYNRDHEVKLRDVLFLCHAKGTDKAQQAVFDQLVAGSLPTPDTWEVALSAGADKKATFLRLLDEGKLGYFALLRNLRNMVDAGIEPRYLAKYVEEGNGREKILPFRFIAASRACPKMEKPLDKAMGAAIKNLPLLTGKTLVLVDVSSSMEARLSAKSDMTREDAACALAAVINGEEVVTHSFSGHNSNILIPQRSGMAMVEAIQKSQGCSGTDITSAVAGANKEGYDRLILITDEQSYSSKLPEVRKNTKCYAINVANYQHGVTYGGQWVHLDGFSENVLRYIHEYERG